ncbi:hypothetical protein L249_5873 [Ophiocordyceps polyrhachis-furcata BCC 54312]|uniref:Uncharacterized protein n=1 Tax=Ophiocordyceps polyrhachis-furcata BCC 54312 TaxID=1330021 RepID=A0A367L0E8_9HYPO|nr:hypothetical protein L249_5873 [Ophiocordyceps polyrhachis-furcata BCC 54312]
MMIQHNKLPSKLLLYPIFFWCNCCNSPVSFVNGEQQGAEDEKWRHGWLAVLAETSSGCYHQPASPSHASSLHIPRAAARHDRAIVSVEQQFGSACLRNTTVAMDPYFGGKEKLFYDFSNRQPTCRLWEAKTARRASAPWLDCHDQYRAPRTKSGAENRFRSLRWLERRRAPSSASRVRKSKWKKEKKRKKTTTLIDEDDAEGNRFRHTWPSPQDPGQIKPIFRVNILRLICARVRRGRAARFAKHDPVGFITVLNLLKDDLSTCRKQTPSSSLPNTVALYIPTGFGPSASSALSSGGRGLVGALQALGAMGVGQWSMAAGDGRSWWTRAEGQTQGASSSSSFSSSSSTSSSCSSFQPTPPFFTFKPRDSRDCTCFEGPSRSNEWDMQLNTYQEIALSIRGTPFSGLDAPPLCFFFFSLGLFSVSFSKWAGGGRSPSIPPPPSPIIEA